MGSLDFNKKCQCYRSQTPHVPKPPILPLSIKSLHNLLEIIGRINNPE
jgi:hypothetical protein